MPSRICVCMCMCLYKTSKCTNPMITSRSFDYDNILSRHACVIITKRIFSSCWWLAWTRSLERFFPLFILSTRHVQVNNSIDRFSSFSLALSPHPYRVSLHSNFLTCRLELTAWYISLIMCFVHQADKWLAVDRRGGRKKTAAVPLRESFSCFFSTWKKNDWTISKTQRYVIIVMNGSKEKI